jgi:glycosyltransferase involved in cell wall biosynthesis
MNIDYTSGHERILYVITRAERGGAQSHVLTLLEAAKGIYDVALAVGEEGVLAVQARRLNVPVFVLPHLCTPLNPMKDLLATAECKNVMDTSRPSSVHAHSSKAGIVARLVARTCRVPCVFTAHGWAFTDGASLMRKITALPIEALAGHLLGGSIIAVSHFDRDLAVRYRIANPKSISAIWNGLSDNPYRAVPAAGHPPVITMVARFNMQKDHLALVRALSRVHHPFLLQFVGDGSLRNEVCSAAESLGMADRTRFLPSDEDVLTVLLRSHIFALISRYEGLPISILEAMRAGPPIVATAVGGIPEMVRDGWNGMLVGRGNEEELCNALELLLSCRELRGRLGKNSRIAFAGKFMAKTMIERTFEIYDRTMEKLPSYSSTASEAATGAL